MARWKDWLRCIGQAVYAKGWRGLVGLAPFGEVLYDIAEDAVVRLRGDNHDNPAEMRAGLAEVAQAPPDQVKTAAGEIAHELAAHLPPGFGNAIPAEQLPLRMMTYLAQVPAAVRQSLRRPADPTGCTAPPALLIGRAGDLLPLLPQGMPRYRAGERPAGIGDWELVELLGIGGFGEVWLARNPHLPQPVALKFCVDQAAAATLRHEAALLGRIVSQGTHPGIVRLLHTYLNADPPCLEYEYVSGGDLTGLVGQWQQPPTDRPLQAAHLIAELAEIVAFAHKLDPPIVHRDLKPANILLQPRQAGGSFGLRVADFGIGGVAARQACEQSVRGSTLEQFLATALRGSHTPLYASPQQMDGAPPDPRDDVHALGVIWYQLLTGDLTHATPLDWREELDRLGVPEAHQKVLASCLASKAEKRLPNAARLAEGLRALIAPTAQLLPWMPSWLSGATPQATPFQPATGIAPAPAPTSCPPKPGTGATPAPGPERFDNSVGMAFVLIRAGTFLMGSPDDEPGRSPDEGPQHLVRITKPFYLGVTPVTQEQYRAVTGRNPARFHQRAGGGPGHPVESVSWEEAVAFLAALSNSPVEKAAGRVYRLPTEAEWEYACRAGTQTAFHFGTSISGRFVNCDCLTGETKVEEAVYREKTTPAGTFPANDWGLHDMHGNVWEWCQDCFDAGFYAVGPEDDPVCDAGDARVLRGGSWNDGPDECRSAHRHRLAPGRGDYSVGFRAACGLG
jgi:formylglycine-generating enzyme required for sulfatase activity